MQQDLFGSRLFLPDGLRYQTEFIGEEEELELLTAIRRLPLQETPYKQYTAKRRTVSYGSRYDFGRGGLDAASPIPDFLLPLCDKAARWLGVAEAALVHGLVSEYRPGTALGWHRDVPEFERIFGLSLGGSGRMRLRPWRPGEPQRRQDVQTLELAARSAYEISGAARWAWQHSIAPARTLRYSITFRTARARATKT